MIAGVFIFIPLTIACIYLDSIYYMGANTSSSGSSLDQRDLNKEFEWTLTGYNFLQVNVLQGLSKYFGDHQFGEYIFNYLPKDIFKVFYPLLILGTYKYSVHHWNKKLRPDLMYISVFYIMFFSFIGHKENRFLLPILPFMFLMTGYSVPLIVKKYSKVTRIAFWIYILVDAFFFGLR